MTKPPAQSILIYKNIGDWLRTTVTVTQGSCFKFIGVLYKDYITDVEFRRRTEQTMKISWPQERDTTSNGKDLSQDHEDLPWQYCKALYREEENWPQQKKRWEENITEWTGTRLNDSPDQQTSSGSGVSWSENLWVTVSPSQLTRWWIGSSTHNSPANVLISKH